MVASTSLSTADIGRPLSGVRHALVAPVNRVTRGARPTAESPAPIPIEQLIREVIDTVSVREHEVQDNHGHFYLLHARPYMTLDNKPDWMLLVLVEVNDLKRKEQEVRAARDYAEHDDQAVSARHYRCIR